MISSTIFKTADISVYRKFSLWLCLSFYVCASLYLSLSSSSLLITLGCFFQCPPLPVQYKNETITKSQLEVLFHEILHLREPLVGSFVLVLYSEQLRANYKYILYQKGLLFLFLRAEKTRKLIRRSLFEL